MFGDLFQAGVTSAVVAAERAINNDRHFRDFLNEFRFESLLPLHGNVNLVDWEAFVLDIASTPS